MEECILYIDTHSKETMEHSICDYLSISIHELNFMLEKASRAASESTFFNCVTFDGIINEFIIQHLPEKQIDEILFFHLGRRLNDAQKNYDGNNLFNLLTTENVFSSFLKDHKVTFIPKDGHLQIYYKNELVSLDKTYETNVPYLRSRLGYNKGREDYCFNGFAFKDILYKNSYARELYDVPEFIGVLATFLNKDKIGTDYFKNSKYYCYEYCLPIENVLFDNDEKMSLESKKIYIVNQVLHRLHYYLYSDITYMNDDDNPVLRLKDDEILNNMFFVNMEEVTYDTLL